MVIYLKVVEFIFESNLVGSLIGTLIAGFITLTVFKKQIGYDRDTRRMEELERYLKLNSYFEGGIKVAFDELTKLVNAINSDDNTKGVFQQSTKDKGKYVIQLINNAISESEKFKFIDLPYEIYYEYIGSIELLKIIKLSKIFNDLDAEIFKTDWLFMSNTFDEFKDEIKRLEIAVKNIVDYREKSDNELIQLKAKWKK